MNEQEIENRIRDYILNTYCCTFNGLLQVEKLKSGYSLKLGVPSYLMPTTIASDLEDAEEFILFACEELRVRNYARIYFYKVNRKENDREE